MATTKGKGKSKVVRTKPGLVSYPNLHKPQLYQGKLSFGVTLVFNDPKDAAPLRQAADEAIKAEFPSGKPPKNFALPFHLGSEKENEDGEMPTGYTADSVYVKFSRKEEFGAPAVVGPDVQPIGQSEIYPGCKGIVACRPYIWHHKDTGNRGLSFGLEGFQKVGDGERIGGFDPLDPDETFEVVTEE